MREKNRKFYYNLKMHFGRRLAVSVCFILALPATALAQKPGGFEDFKDQDIILKDKDKDASSLDFMGEEKEAAPATKKKSVDDEGVLTNLEKEVEKSRGEEAKDQKKAEEAIKKRTLKQKEQEAEAPAPESEDELLLKEDEQEQADIDEESAPETKQKQQEVYEQPLPEENPEEVVEQQEEKQTPAGPSRKWTRPRQGTLPQVNQEEEEGDAVKVGDVVVEKFPYGKATQKCNCRYDTLIPYALRRNTWTNTVSLGVNTYTPTNYQPDAYDGDLETVYGDAETPLLELTFGFKYNFALGSLALDLGGGYYSNTKDTLESKLNLIFTTAALTFALDNLFKEPYVVPYGTVGIGYVLYSETVANNENGGGTKTMYAGAGLQFQLDWMDEQANIDSYEDFGLENTFLYLEARYYLDATSFSDPASPDLSSEKIALLSGLKFEF